MEGKKKLSHIQSPDTQSCVKGLSGNVAQPNLAQMYKEVDGNERNIKVSDILALLELLNPVTWMRSPLFQ